MHKPIEGRADWLGAEIANSTAWVTELTPDDRQDVKRAFAFARQRGATLETMTKEDFPLPVFGPKLDGVMDEVERGLGFHLVRGFPIEGYSKDDLRLIYWGLGKHMGTAVSQSMRGDLIGDVRDFHLGAGISTMRGYTSNGGQGFHTDSCDVSALFTLRQGIAGGESHVESSVAIHNELLRTRPDLVDVLYEPFYWSWQGQELEGEKPYYQQPVFSVQDGHFCCRIIAMHIQSAQLFPEVPRLTAAQIEAIAAMRELQAQERFQVHFKMQPGDLEILNSHVTFHGRTKFTDGDDEAHTRHLLRMWLSVPRSRPLSPLMGGLYRDQRPGVVRGGFRSRSGQHVYETRVTTD